MAILSASKSPTCLDTSPALTNRQSSNIRSNPTKAKTFHEDCSFCESQALTEATTPAAQMTSHGNAGGCFRRGNFIVNALRSAISACNLCKKIDEILASQNRIFAELDSRLDRVESRLDLIDSRLAHLEIRVHSKYPRQLQILYKHNFVSVYLNPCRFMFPLI
jgi:hypothetical protein